MRNRTGLFRFFILSVPTLQRKLTSNIIQIENLRNRGSMSTIGRYPGTYSTVTIIIHKVLRQGNLG